MTVADWRALQRGHGWSQHIIWFVSGTIITKKMGWIALLGKRRGTMGTGAAESIDLQVDDWAWRIYCLPAVQPTISQPKETNKERSPE